MYLIKELGLEKCKQIVDGAPDWSNSYDLKGKDYWKGGVFATAVSIDDLRTAIANHENANMTGMKPPVMVMLIDSLSASIAIAHGIMCLSRLTIAPTSATTLTRIQR